MTKDEKLRYQGARWALDMIKSKGVDETIKDLEWRGVTMCPLKVSQHDIDDFVETAKRKCVLTVCCMAAAVLHDEFDFGQSRINKFVQRFNQKTECLTGDFTTWSGIKDALKEETGIDFLLPKELLEDDT